MATAVLDVPGFRSRSRHWQVRFVRLMKSIGADPSLVAAVISFETGGTFNPQERNPDGAIGLIQWTTSGAKSQGYEREQIGRMSDEGQLDLLTLWFEREKPSRLKRPIDYYLAVFAPAAIGKPMGASVYSLELSPKSYAANISLDRKPRDGIITVQDIASHFLPVISSAKKRPPVMVVDERWPSVVALLLAVGIIGGAIYYDRKVGNPRKPRAKTLKIGTYTFKLVPTDPYGGELDVISTLSGNRIGHIVEYADDDWATEDGDGRWVANTKTLREGVELLAGKRNPKKLETEREVVDEMARLGKRYDAAWDRIARGTYKGDRPDAIARAEKIRERIDALEVRALEVSTWENPSARAQKRLQWGILKSKVLGSKDREKQARAARKAQLEVLRDDCKARKAQLRDECAQARTNARLKAREAVAEEKKFREEKRGDYRFAVGQTARSQRQKRAKRYSAAESDSLARQNIPADLRDLFDEHARDFSRKLEPDHRAELFGEWVEENQGYVDAWKAERFDISDREFAKLEREAHEERVPF